MRKVLTLALGAAAVGGAAVYQRRNQHAANTLKGAAHAVTPSIGRDDADDQTLADRVKSEIFRDHDAPKAGVSVDVQAGVAYLRGEVADEAWIERFGSEARKVHGIQGVKNLLHAPGTATPAAPPRFVASEHFRH